MATRIELTKEPATLIGIQNARYYQPIGKGAYLFDSRFNERTYIHIREVLYDKTPTKNGISLTLQRCNELFSSLSHIDIAVQQMELNQDTFYRRHIGGNWYVTVQSGFKCVDIRQFWLPDGETDIRATRKGISLNFQQYKELKNGLGILPSFVPELYGVIPCYRVPDHDQKTCKECTPA